MNIKEGPLSDRWMQVTQEFGVVGAIEEAWRRLNAPDGGPPPEPYSDTWAGLVMERHETAELLRCIHAVLCDSRSHTINDLLTDVGLGALLDR